MDLNFEKLFDKPTHENWKELAAKSLKLESIEDLEKFIQIVSLEELNYQAYPQDIAETYLNTFPTERLLAREILAGQPNKETVDVGINYIFSYQPVVPHENQKLIQVINTKETKHFGDEVLLDVFSLLKVFDYSEQDLCEYLEKSSKQDNVHLLIDLSQVHNAGGSIIHEVAHGVFLALKFCHHFIENNRKVCFSLSVDSQVFTQIAKIRALRYIFETVLESEKLTTENFLIIATNSLREQTIYDPWMNMLRGCSGVTSAFIGGADVIMPKSFDILNQEYEMQASSDLGLRQSRNTYHILKEESLLSFVNDPSRGSAIIEDLTHQIIQKSYSKLKDLKSQKSLRFLYEKLAEEVTEKSLERKKILNKRKMVLSGVNDFANIEEKLKNHFKLKHLEPKNELFPLRRTASHFEELRLEVEMDKKVATKKCLILYYGDLKKLSARLRFSQNYFEVLGLEVEVFNAQEKKIFNESDYHIVTYCALDTDYEEFFELTEPLEKGHLFIAGKSYSKMGLTNIYQGQDVYEILSSVIKKENSK